MTEGLDAARLARLIDAGRALVVRARPRRRSSSALLDGRARADRRALRRARRPRRATARELERFLTRGIDARRAPRDRRPAARARRPRRADRRPAAAAAATTSATHPRSYGFPPGHPPMGTLPRRADPRPRRGVGQPLPDGEGGRRAVHRRPTRRPSSIARRLGGDRDRERAPVRRRPSSAATELERAVRGLEATTRDRPRDRRRDRPRPRARADRQARPRARRRARRRDRCCRRRRARGGGGRRRGRRRRSARGCATRALGEVLQAGARALADVPRAPAVAEARRARAALLVPLVFRGAALGVLAAFDRRRRRRRASTPRTSGCCRPSPPARRPRWPPRSAWSATAAARDRRRRGRSAGAGRASCTTRRCRGSAALRVLLGRRAARRDPDGARSGRAPGRRADRRRRSRACAR